MKTFTAYQNILSSEIIDQVNSMGRDKVLSEILKYAAYLDLRCFGSKKWEPEMIQHFEAVAQVELPEDSIQPLEDVFHMLNVPGMPYKKLVEQHRSLSVGDLIRDDQTGEFFLVENFGFEKVEIA